MIPVFSTSNMRSLNYIRPPKLFPLLFRDVVFRVPGIAKTIYITFDDGPTPGVSSEVLDILRKYGVKATFFVCGEKAERFQDLFRRICDEGHAVGNHSYSHLNGWKTKTTEYISDVERTQKLVQSKLFRPPYGKLTFRQYRILRKRYRIVVWDVMCGDFDPSVSAQLCFERIRQYAVPGSVIVFHDSEKALGKFPFLLEQTLDYFVEKGYQFEKLS